MKLVTINDFEMNGIEQGKNDLERQSWFGYYSGFVASKYAWLNIGEGEGTLQWQQKCEE